MIDNSAKYGLYNPAFTEDIGYLQLAKMGVNDDFEDYAISGVTGSMDGINIKGALPEDKVELSNKSKNNKKKILTGIITALGVVAAGIACWKFNIFSKIKSLIKKP